MSFPQEVKQIAYKLDPECWASYSGKPKPYKQMMDIRRTASLQTAQAEYESEKPEPECCPTCGRPL